jgi:hypothetical protein
MFTSLTSRGIVYSVKVYWKRNKNRNSLHLIRSGDCDDHNEFWGKSCEACGIHVQFFFSGVGGLTYILRAYCF